MKITITSSEDGRSRRPFILGDDAQKWAISDYLPGQSRIGQATPLFRASYQRVFNRRNRLNALSFVVSRTHADDTAAFLYSKEHPKEVPEQGTLLVYHRTSIQRMANAFVVDVVCQELKGSHTLFAYSIIGGEWTT